MKNVINYVITFDHKDFLFMHARDTRQSETDVATDQESGSGSRNGKYQDPETERIRVQKRKISGSRNGKIRIQKRKISGSRNGKNPGLAYKFHSDPQ